MKSLASELKFEQAAKIKYDIDSLRSLQEHQIVRDFVSGDFDVVHIIQKYEKNYVGCIEIRDSKIM
jgi:excinuclease UvrABC nuclease subunit